MKIFLWTLAAILALNAVAAIGIALWDLVLRRRGSRGSMGGETLRRLRPAGEPVPIRLGPTSVMAAGNRRRRSRPGPVGIAVAAALLFAGTALASPGARHVVAGAFGAVVRSVQPASDQQAGEAADPAVGGSPLPASGSSAPQDSASVATDPPRSAAGSATPAAPTSSSSVPAAATPASPTAVAAVPGSSTELRLTWGDVGRETGYRVERSTDGATGWTTIATTGQDATTTIDAGLPSGTTFYYRVFASNGGTDSPPSNIASATTTVDPPTPTAVTAVAVSSTEIDLTWGDVVDETGYRVERSADGVTGWITVATTGQDVTNATDAGLPSGTTFYYRVFASNAGGDSPASDVASATTVDGGGDPATEAGG